MKPVADDDFAACQRRQDYAVEMIGTCCHMGKSLRTKRERCLVEQDQFAQRLCTGRAAGLTREQDLVPGFGQCRMEETGLGRFARALSALEGYEKPAHALAMGRRFGTMAQARKGTPHEAEAGHGIGGHQIETYVRHALILQNKRTERLTRHDRSDGR